MEFWIWILVFIGNGACDKIEMRPPAFVVVFFFTLSEKMAAASVETLYRLKRNCARGFVARGLDGPYGPWNRRLIPIKMETVFDTVNPPVKSRGKLIEYLFSPKSGDFMRRSIGIFGRGGIVSGDAPPLQIAADMRLRRALEPTPPRSKSEPSLFRTGNKNLKHPFILYTNLYYTLEEIFQFNKISY